MSFSLKHCVLGVTLATSMVGCAVVPPHSGENPADPFETVNRQTHAFNMKLDELILHPLAVNYVEYVPKPVQIGVSNFFQNLGELDNTLNNLLQGKLADSGVSFVRFLVNSTIGVAGIFDVASHWNLAHAPEDFGQTLGKWGVPQGPYIVWPMLGYSTVRDSIGKGVSAAMSPMTYVSEADQEWHWLAWSASGVYMVNERAKLLATDAMLGTALDPYVAIRDAYLQHRLSMVWDGNPPIELPVDEFEDEEF